MWLPRHDTPLSLPAEPPRQAILSDEALLDQVQPGGQALERWYTASAPAVVVGLGLWHRLSEVVDLARCAAAGVEVVHRRAGGGAVLLDQYMLCGAICVPLPDDRIMADVTDSYRWLGEDLMRRVRELGATDARRVEVDEARSDIAALRAQGDAVSRLLLATCYGALSPHELVTDGKKLVGLAQVRRRHAALFQFGILLRDQSPLADLLRVPTEQVRHDLKLALQRRSVGLPR